MYFKLPCLSARQTLAARWRAVLSFSDASNHYLLPTPPAEQAEDISISLFQEQTHIKAATNQQCQSTEGMH